MKIGPQIGIISFTYMRWAAYKEGIIQLLALHR